MRTTKIPFFSCFLDVTRFVRPNDYRIFLILMQVQYSFSKKCRLFWRPLNMETDILVKCSLAISLACLTRYEGWLLPLDLIFAILFILLLITREPQKHRIEPFLFATIILAIRRNPTCCAGYSLVRVLLI